MSAQQKGSSIESRQYLVRFKADTVSHLHVLDPDICATKCPDKLISKRGHGIIFRLA